MKRSSTSRIVCAWPAGRRPLFSTLSCLKIFRLAGGIPRLINQLCDHSLVYAYALQAEMVTALVVLDSARARDCHGFLPLRSDPGSIEPSQSELAEETAELAALAQAVSGDVNGSSPKSSPLEAADPSGAYHTGLALKQAGEFTRAVALFDGLTADPVWGTKSLAQKGLCLKAIGRYDEAVATFRDALERPTSSTQDHVSLRYLLARTLEAMGRLDEAVDVYRTLQRKGQGYRDVATRIDRLNDAEINGHAVRTAGVTRLGSLIRGWGQLFRGAHAQWFVSLK